MRVVAIGLVFAGAASAVAQDYNSPVPPMPKSVDTSSANPGTTALPSGDTPATAQASQSATAQSSTSATAKPK
jgi:hypothetical protein